MTTNDPIKADARLPFREEFPHIWGWLTFIAKWAAFYAVVIPLAVWFPAVMFGFAMGFICASLIAAWETGQKRIQSSEAP